MPTRSAVALAAVAVALGGCRSGRRPPPPAAQAACVGAVADREALREHVEVLAGRLAPRDVDHPANLDAAAAYVAERLRAAGLEPREQVFEAFGRKHRNVLAAVGPDTPERIVIGAHYDAAAGTPGADDNASGVAGLLELARLLAAAPPPLQVELAAYALEEPPAFGTESMGSAVHARSLADAGVKVRLMIAIEMIGYYSDAPGSQRYPTAMESDPYPDTGNFISVVGRRGHGGMVSRIAGAIAAASSVPVETLVAPRDAPGVALSDHRNFWERDFPAVMVTNTAFYRNERYHTARDRPDTLDYLRMAEVVEGLHCAVQSVARQ
jgi:Peptidase family M28